MNKLTFQVQQLRSTLRKEIHSGGPARSQIKPRLKELARLVLRALNDNGHPLAEKFVELRQWIGSHRNVPAKQQDHKTSSPAPQKKASPPVLVLSDKHLFMPQPGNRSAQIRSFWPLQLLLYAVAQSSHRAELEQHVGLDEQRIILAVKEAIPTGIGLWSEHQF